MYTVNHDYYRILYDMIIMYIIIGDIMIFNTNIIHGSCKNMTKKQRFSIDFRVALEPFNRSNYGSTGPSKYMLNNRVAVK